MSTLWPLVKELINRIFFLEIVMGVSALEIIVYGGALVTLLHKTFLFYFLN